jgi:quinol monooxygenase YgiN
MVKLGLFVKLEAKPGKEQELEKLVKGALPLALEEPGTTAWFAVKFGPSTFAIFDVFKDESGRSAHLNGRIAQALMAKAGELLTEAPRIERHDVLGAKLPQ